MVLVPEDLFYFLQVSDCPPPTYLKCFSNKIVKNGFTIFSIFRLSTE